MPVTPHDLLPEQNIEVEGSDLPQWKIIWDAARNNALKGDFDEALHFYKALLKMKNNLDEARWEMARLLMYLKRWDEAVEPLERLTGSEPDSTLYISSLGKVMWEMKQYERAVDLFHKIYLSNPTDQMALAGLVEGLTKLERKDEALPYLEQLSRQEPTNRGVRRYLAFLFYDEKKYEKARPHFTILTRSEEVEPDVLYKTAKTYGYLGLDLQAAIYWERFLARQPENLEGHRVLSQYYVKSNQPERAIQHIKALVNIKPDDVILYTRLGEAYEKSGDREKALHFYERYLERVPEDQEVKQRLLKLTAVGPGEKTALSLSDQYSITESGKKSAELAEAILNYKEANRFRDTIPFYRELLERTPGNQKVLAALADDLIVLGEREGQISMVKCLSEIAMDNIGLYKSMADLFEQLKRDDELLAVLHKTYDLAPGDDATTRKLAILYLQKGELLKSREFFGKLSDAGCRDIKCLEAGAELSEKLRRPEHELRYYEALLKKQPDRYTVRLRVINLAANLGLLDNAVYHAGYLQHIPSVREKFDLKILLADAYMKSGYLSRARERYRKIIDELSLQKDAEAEQLRLRSWLGIAESYKEVGLIYEAEQSLRVALATEKNRLPFLEYLFQLALNSGDVSTAAIWLQAFNNEQEKLGPAAAAQFGLAWKKHILRAEMAAAENDFNQAVQMCRKALSSLIHQGMGIKNHNDLFSNGSARFRINIHLAANLISAGEFSEAENILRGLQDKDRVEPESFVLLEQLYKSAGKRALAEDVAAEAEDFAEEDFGRKLALIKLYRKYNNLLRYLEFSETALKMMPDSLLAQRQIVEARIANGAYLKALALLDQLQSSYPDNSWLLSRQVELLARTGNFPEALAIGDVILAENPARADIVLLKARILWEMNRWKDSVELYESITSPLVEDILKSKIPEVALTVTPDQRKDAWWELLAFSKKSSNLSELIMSPFQAVDFSEKSQVVNTIAAQYFALYQWQKRLSWELSVRRSVMRRDYYHAANMLEDLIEEYGRVDFLVYDLGGLYSKLDRLGDEAVIYRELELRNADFPGLSEAVQRNNLKRRPQVFFTYAILEDDGWNGYKAVRQKIMRGGGWYYQSVNRKWSMDLARTDYESTDDAQEIWGLRTKLMYDAKISPTLSISLGGGVEELENGYGTIPLFYGSITGELADAVWAAFSVKQDKIPDTLASLKRNIKRRDYKIEFIFDVLPRVVLGGFHDYIDYSDSNWTKNYTLWASYILLPEPTLLKISYNYDFYDSREGQKQGAVTADGFALDDHPYWSPQNYWITRFSLYLKHHLSNDALARGIPSYYTLEYSLGYDSYDNDLHELKAGLNIEIAKNYILGGSYGYVDLDVCQYHETSLSIMYRW
ncbi:MAG: tetratricopeptide repeat protein [Deltaproteobacteria bacterium]|nr:tetratricopeptide repeat protein [Deltaproteobacteria bacterium]